MANNCFGVEAFAYWAANTGPAGKEVPPGWEYTQTYDPAVTSHYYVDVMQCERFSGGPFERGPVTFLWESHTQANFPSDCFSTPDSDINDLEILVALWTDDEAIATWLHDSYGIPTRVASFKVDNVTTPVLDELGWRWHSGGSNESSFYLPFTSATEPRFSTTERVFYHDGNSVIGLDRTNSWKFISDFNRNQMHGSFESPMLQANSGLRAFVGLGGAFIESSISAELQRYGDLQCEEPL